MAHVVRPPRSIRVAAAAGVRAARRLVMTVDLLAPPWEKCKPNAMSPLFGPLVFRTGLTARNRLILAPLTNMQSHADGSLGDDELRWLTSRAEGGFGLVMTCAAHVARDGQGWRGELGVFDDALLPGLTRLATALGEHGAASLVQLFHGGLRADPSLTGLVPWSASEGDGCRAATEQDLTRVIAQFSAAARRSQEAGFDGVELHGAHGYLFTQFLSVTQNRRLDQWGGTLENRARLLRETVRAVRAAVGASFTVGVRLSPEDFGNARGLDLDESVQVAEWLADDGVDFVHLSLWQALASTAKRPEANAIPLFRSAVPSDVRVLAAGGIWTRAEAEEVLRRGADAVVLGRSAIVNADWPRRAADPGWAPRRPPVTIDSLVASGLSRPFAEHMRRFKDFVVEESR
ncbi:MAG TPA: NADH:flavin oxidoreductase [Vicinamibacterales bacterium]|nr:NADH:flavin oxidoreductase [Vicinamibacterales bacterium]